MDIIILYRHTYIYVYVCMLLFQIPLIIMFNCNWFMLLKSYLDFFNVFIRNKMLWLMPALGTASGIASVY